MTRRTLRILLLLLAVPAIGIVPAPLRARGGSGSRPRVVGKSAVEKFLTELEHEVALREREDRASGGRTSAASAAFEEMTLEILSADRKTASSQPW